MKTIFSFLFSILISNVIAQSCCSGGMCVTSSSNDYIVNGLQSSINVRFTTLANRFELRSNVDSDFDIAYRDYFQQLNFAGRWNIKDKVAITADIPFAFNLRKEQNNSTFMTGLGDISIGVVGQLPTITHNNSKHRVFLGFSFVAPTGEYKRATDTTGFSPIILPGTGMWVFSPSAEYIVSVKDYSIAAGLNYRYALANADKLQMGGRTISWARFAYSKKIKTDRYIPSVSAVYEWLQQNKFKYQDVSLSGGHLFSLEAALDIKIKEKWGFSCRYRQPVYQYLSKNYLKQYGTASVQFNHFF